MVEFKIKRAINSDLEFILDCIVESEKSGTQLFGYSEILGVSEAIFRENLIQIFEEEIEGQPWNLIYWYIAEVDGKNAAGLCSWVEGETGISSDLAKVQLLNYQFPSNFKERTEQLQIVGSISIPRMSGYLQFEHLYTKNDYRGKGLMKSIIEFVQKANEGLSSEIQVLQQNTRAMSFYQYIGFTVNEIKCNQKIKDLNLLADSCKVQLIKHGSQSN